MSFLAVTLPVSLLLAGILLFLVVRAARQGQWDDWEGPAWRHHFDEDARAAAHPGEGVHGVPPLSGVHLHVRRLNATTTQVLDEQGGEDTACTSGHSVTARRVGGGAKRREAACTNAKHDALVHRSGAVILGVDEELAGAQVAQC